MYLICYKKHKEDYVMKYFIFYFCVWFNLSFTFSLDAQIREGEEFQLPYEMNSCAEDLLKSSINESLTAAIAKETDPFSLKPFHLFYRSIFWSSADRYAYWIAHFDAYGLDEQSIKTLIKTSTQNCQISYHDMSDETSLTNLKFQSQCLNEPRFLDTIHRIELNGWFWNVWFDVLLFIVFLLVILPLYYLIKPFSWTLMVSTLGIKLLFGIVFFFVIRLCVFSSSADQQILLNYYFDCIVR